MNPIRVWAVAARPKTLVVTLSVILMGTTLSLAEGYFDSVIFLMTLLTALGIQIGTNYANDYFDFIKGCDTAQRKGPLRVTQAGLVSLTTMKRAIFFIFLATAISGCYLIWVGGIVIAFLVAIAILLAICYTGGPFPLAYLGLGDLFVLIFYGPVAVASTYYLQTHRFSWEPVVAGIAMGMLSTTLLIINNIRDIHEDKAVDKKTLPVRFGKTFGKIEYLFAILSASAIPFLFIKDHPFCLIATLFLLPALPLIKAVFSKAGPDALNLALGKTGQLLFLYTLLFCIGWMVR